MKLLKIATLIAGLMSGSAFAGTYDGTGNSAAYGTGWAGQGLTGGYITTPLALNTALGTQAITIEARFKTSTAPTAAQGAEVIVGSSGMGWIGITPQGTLRFSNNSTNGSELDTDTASPVTDGQWHVATMVISPAVGSNPELFIGYLDGALIGIKTANIQWPNASKAFGIGAFETGGYQFSGVISDVSFWNVAKNWSSFTPLSVPYQGIENGAVALYHLNGNATDSVTTPVTAPVAGTSSPVYFSPYTWADTSAGRITIDAGAYLKTTYSGSQCSITINPQPQNMGSTPTEIEVWVDGLPGTVYSANQDSVPCSPSALVTTSVHSVRMAFKSSSETLTRWATAPATELIVRGINIGTNQTFSLPKIYPRLLLFYGDSITEGVRTLGETQPLDTDRNDNAVEWSAQTAQRLNAEYGIVGFGATGLVVGGSGGVPALTTAWNMLYPGQPRSFATCPDAMIENEGTNDASQTAPSVQAAETTFLQAFSTMCPTSKAIVMRPFGGQQWTALQASVASMGSRNISLLDTTGFLNTAMGVDSLGLHPTANNAVNFLAPQVTAAIERIMSVRPAQTFTYH
ncbi:LamG-like jellyroll fold domain-containing protein [Gluconobacter kondonii]|uniref:LamG-like jellyroll fold domain-containing protein n=1 Tax=Gluconobacter kondonii TaxID=941463 RepID=UPI00197D3BD4|nr:LamG-like jellyroll fold domain-containing protein [Gluconobacter kondonii]MBN3866468.1 hypothetical protein [Gluconobacter kondonii]